MTTFILNQGFILHNRHVVNELKFEVLTPFDTNYLVVTIQHVWINKAWNLKSSSIIYGTKELWSSHVLYVYIIYGNENMSFHFIFQLISSHKFHLCFHVCVTLSGNQIQEFQTPFLLLKGM